MSPWSRASRMTWRKKTRACVVDFPARANWWVSSLLQTCLKRESSVCPSMTFAMMGRERNRPKILFNYFGWRTFWYRDNFGLLKRHRDASLYHRGIIDISDDWWKFKSKLFPDFPRDGIRPSWLVRFNAPTWINDKKSSSCGLQWGVVSISSS